MNLSAERAKVRKKYPRAYAYNWAARDWVIYAAKNGALAGIAITGQCTSEAHAWVSAARDVHQFLSPFRVKVPRLRRVSTRSHRD